MLNLIKDQSELLKINKSRANILKKANSKFHEVSVAFSPDNKTIYFTRNNYGKRLRRDKNGVNHLKIYKLIKVGGEWSSATELAFNSDSYSADHPALSPEGRQIYFDFDKFKVRSDAAQEFNKLVGVMNEHPSIVIKIESLTDSKGSKDYNRFLSGKVLNLPKILLQKKV